jgi:hypothetical protein
MVRRRTTAVLAAVACAALLPTALPAGAGAAMRSDTSANWAGYVVSKPGMRFRRVASTWVQPAASCSPGQRRYSAYWVGLGGYHSTANALEQIGTQVDCSSKGQAFTSAWYELVPAGPIPIKLAIRPGDTISASVTMTGHRVKLFMANRTLGTSFSRYVHAPHIDLTSAEWIVEAPSACDGEGCHTLPLANFGSASFSGARATTVGGHGGPIADPAWSATAIQLSPALAFGAGVVMDSSDAGATPGDLSAAGDGFTVTYQDAPGAPAASGPSSPPTPPVPPAPAPGASPAPAPIPPPAAIAVPVPLRPVPLPVGWP